mmetsp:Transcript_1412/g.5590  ORF Transcript_1412/g.5590 Transcript_1412/m.5590 type:complete len:203 (+) Transcript_1412:702-1310(+)
MLSVFSRWPSGTRFHALRPRSMSSAVCQSPFASASVATTAWSRTFSGGPVKGWRELMSSSLRSGLEKSFPRRSCEWMAMLATSNSIAQIRCTASSSSRLMCMWKGICLRLSNFSRSGSRSWKRCSCTPWASSSFTRPPMYSSLRHECASRMRPAWKALRPSCAMARLKRICVATSMCCTLSCMCDMSSRSRARWKSPASAFE